MQVDVYRSAKNPSKCLVLPTGSDPNHVQTVEPFDDDLREVTLPRNTMTIERSGPMLGIDVGRIIDEVQAKGWSTIAPRVSVGSVLPGFRT